MTDKAKYPGYNGLGRTPGVWGVPYMPALVVLVGSMFVALGSAGIWGPGGLLFYFLGVPVLLFFKHVCETDDQGLRILWLELRCRWYWRRLRILSLLKTGRRFPVVSSNVSTLAPLRLGRHARVYKQFFTRSKADLHPWPDEQ
jgi:type IV secretion system protein VirB3